MPEVPYFPHGLDADDEDSDDESEFDFATIDEFLQLHNSPDHAQLLIKLLCINL